MNGQNENIEIKLVARADMGELTTANRDLKTTDAAAAKAEQSLKRLETQAKRTADAVSSIPRSGRAFAGLATSPTSSTFTSPESLRAAEAAAGRRTENSMRAEDDEAAAQALRRRRFFEAAQAQRSATSAAHESSALDGVSATRGQAVGALIGTAETIGVAAKAFKELNEQQAASQELAAAMYNRGIASDDFFQRLHRVAEEMRKETGTKNSTWIGALTDLVSSGANEGNIDKLAKGVENLAGLMNGNIPSAAQAMERAMQGNFETLTHWGIVVPETATQAQKLESALKQLAERGAGLMESRSKTLAGQWDNLKNSGFNLMAAFADTFTHSELLKQSMAGLGAIMQKAAEWIGLPVPKLEALNTKLVASSRALGDAQNAARKTAQEYASIATQADRAKDAMDRQHRAESSIRTAEENIASARKDLAQAQIDSAVHSGRITPQQGEIQSAGLQFRFEQGRFARNQQAQVDEQHVAEVRLNQLGNQRGMLTSEASDVQRQLDQFQQAHAARAEVANQQNAVREAEAKLAEFRSRPTAASAAASGGEVSLMGPIQDPAEIERTQAFLEESQGLLHNRQNRLAGLPNISDEQGAALQDRLAKLTTAMDDLGKEIRKETPGLQDSAGNARLNQKANSIIFQAVQQTIATVLNDHLSQSQVQGGNTPAVRAAINNPNEAQLINELRTALLMRNEALTSGFAQIVNDLNADIASIRAQLRTLGARR